MPATVYISSTYSDLKKHRAAVRNFFNKFPDFFTAVSMENYLADDVRPIDECMRDVRNCKFYVLILANRYGFIPEMCEGKKNDRQLSVTELEFNTAVASGAKIFAFIAKGDSPLFDADSDKDPAMLEIKKKGLERFKSKVLDNYLVHPERFISSKDLAIQVQETFFKARWKYPELFTGQPAIADINIHEDRIYCCNRETQFNEYLAVTTKSCFKTWLIYGQEEDMVESFTARISKLSLDVNITYEATLNTIFGSGNSYDVCKAVFLNAVYKKIFNKMDDEVDVNIEKFVTDISRHTVFENTEDEKSPARLAFIVSCSTIPDQKDVRFTYLQQFLFDFYETCNKLKCATIYFFINIEFAAENEAPFKQAITALKNSTSAADYFFPLSQLGKAESKDIDLWLKNYLTDVSFKINMIKKSYFKNLPPEFQMSEAEQGLYLFIKKLNKKDPTLLEILE